MDDIERSNRQCWSLVKATDANEISELEARFGISQENAVVHFVEQIEWGIETFPQYQDRKGSFQERLSALRTKLADWEKWEDWEPVIHA